MLKIVYAGKIDGYFKSDVLLTAGQLVKADPANAGKVIAVNAGDAILGVLAQDVISGNVDNFKLSSVTHKARQSVDQVGVYFGVGEYVTDQFSGNITQGAQLYAGANGQLVITASGSAVGQAIAPANSATSGSTLRYRLF